MLESIPYFLEASDVLVPSCLSIAQKLGCTPIDVLDVYFQFVAVALCIFGVVTGVLLNFCFPVVISFFRRFWCRIKARYQEWREERGYF